MSTAGGRQTLNEVLVTELGCLRPQLQRNAPPATYQSTDAQRAEDLKGIYQSIDSSRLELSALCLSGGGIRSATFNLGVIQSLARIGLLGKFDYLSSVSGGGYIASWLRAWMHRRGVAEVVRELGQGAKGSDPLNIEPRPVVNLREYSNYLTPAVGLFSGDTWAAAATIVRNLLLNWLVLLPLLSAVVGIPLLFLLAMRTTGISNLSQVCLALALLTEFIASLLVFGSRRLAKKPEIPQGYFIWTCVLPICLAGGLLSTAGVGLDPRVTDNSAPWQFAALWSIGVPILGWGLIELLTRSSRRAQQKTTGKDDTGPQTREQIKKESRQVAPLVELAALVVSGLVGMSLLAKTTQWWFSYLYNHPALYAVLVLPLLLGEYLLSRVLFIGLLSLNDERSDQVPGEAGVRSRISSNDSDREWWSRLSGWLLLVMVCWVAVTGVCLIGCYLPSVLFRLFKQDYATVSYCVKLTVSLLGAITGAISALTSSSARTPGPGAAATQPTPGAMKSLMALTGPVFVICLIMMLSWALKALGEALIPDPSRAFVLHFYESIGAQPVPWRITLGFMGILAWLAVLGMVASRFVNVNRFSLHGMYRNRLVRAYLGASNVEQRTPDPFTGFALNDNFALHELCSPLQAPGAVVPPLSIINTTLNLVNGNKLAWQQRKAESFSMSPLFCGSWLEGYRKSTEYGGPGGVTVGTAVTISGAAASPNSGYSSSPVLGFLMAMFNVRLGAWLGNTNEHGNRTYTHPGPRFSIVPMIAEMFGLTNANRGYVNLSDGGHFDNLGLYEVVLRRCRHVLLSDAGQDGGFSFEDLGNSIRKIRIDFGINIVFEKIQILPNTPEKEGLCCATARIRYSDVDDTPPERDGLLVYIKPTLRGRGAQVPYDIYSYARECEAFPHEPTADQWFSESQFESYRALGAHIMEQLTQTLGDSNQAGFADFHASVKAYLETRAAPPAPLGGYAPPEVATAS
ncbi:MAG: patatin-like phospholipase family protein [Proteobacteria bacterium]|nr:patatin-like phospholipase family protein [Pseudomonadota bacterium]